MGNKKRLTILGLIAVLLATPGLTQAGSPIEDFKDQITTESVMGHIEALAVDIGARPLGSEAETGAAEYVADLFTEWGYEVEIQPFETVPTSNGVACDDPQTVTSHNVIATKPGDEHVIVVGAHIDSVTAGAGAGDNASGVAAMLAAAEAMSDVEMTYTIVFAAFGAQEGGCPTGADYYLQTLGDKTDQIVAMINVDAVGMGTQLNVYAGATITWSSDSEYPAEIADGPTWVRDLALSQSEEMDLPFETTPDGTWGGYIGPWGDHYGFVKLDIPVAYIEAWQWDGAGVTDPWWGTETAAGDMMHTSLDVFENIVPEKVEMAAELVAATAYAIESEDPGRE